MHKFKFRLEKVRHYRSTLEEEAKEAYLAARVERLQAEAELDQIRIRRQELLFGPAHNIDDRLALQRALDASDDAEAHQRMIIDQLEQDEERLRQAWIETKRDLEALEKLKAEAKLEWQAAADREEQANLDEWAVLRRAS